MENSIIKIRHSIIALLMIILHGAGAFASTPWTVNPSDYQYDMSLYLDISLVDVKMNYSQYDVAVFSGDQCRGVAQILSLSDGKECLYLRARSNQESGETMTFKYYNKKTEEILPIEGVSFQFESNGILGYPSAPFIVKIVRYFNVNLNAGNGGTISPQSGRVAEGTKLTVTTTSSEGYHFEQWSDDNTDNPRTIIVDSDVTLTAEFGVNVYKLAYNIDGNQYKEYTVDYGTVIIPEAIPEKEGHTFSGWEGLPETMPAHDITVNGTFTINSYNAVFKIGDDVIETKSIVFGQPVTVPEAPAKEGHTFAGWKDIPETMPAKDTEILGSYTVNSYKLTYVVDGTSHKEYTVDYGTVITPEAIPAKEGHTFSGWEGLPESMPAHDVTVSGAFTINSYNAVFKIGDDVIETKSIVFGQPVTAPEAPAKEGHTFAGWKDIPETMPAKDTEILGSYTVNSYKLTYVVDGTSHKEYTVDYGTVITPEAIPAKEGHTFSGWEGLPETMPAHDITVNGTFTINSYNVVFKIGDDVIETKSIVFGQPVTAPEAPAKEGHTFAGWKDIPETMPAKDTEILGSYTVNSYKLTYVVDGTSHKEYTVDYGTVITPEAIPAKEGHTFSGWEGLPETMPAHDITVNGTFTINSYNVVFKIGDDVIETKSIVFGQPVTAPEAPAKEGHTFAGWKDIPETMPAKDTEILGSYTVNSYKLTYVVDGTSHKEYTVDYGTMITPEAIPAKEGHTFSGWEGLPESMPAHDVTVSGAFTINSYRLTLYLNNEFYHSETIEFGAPVVIKAPDVPEGMKFDGWKNQIPEFMPACDVDIYGTYSHIGTSISQVGINDNTKVTICNLTGSILYRNVNWHDVKNKLQKGVYIINGVKHLVRK